MKNVTKSTQNILNAVHQQSANILQVFTNTINSIEVFGNYIEEKLGEIHEQISAREHEIEVLNDINTKIRRVDARNRILAERISKLVQVDEDEIDELMDKEDNPKSTGLGLIL